MVIEWTKPAKNDLKLIFNYFQKKASAEIALQITNSILDTAEILKTHNIGTVEPLLKNLKQGHRYLVNGNYKIIYFISNDTAYITHAFDTRQNPKALK